MIKKGSEVTQEYLKNFFLQNVRDLNQITFDNLVSLNTGCFTGSSPTYGELPNTNGEQVLQNSASLIKQFTDAIDELKSR